MPARVSHGARGMYYYVLLWSQLPSTARLWGGVFGVACASSLRSGFSSTVVTVQKYPGCTLKIPMQSDTLLIPYIIIDYILNEIWVFTLILIL